MRSRLTGLAAGLLALACTGACSATSTPSGHITAPTASTAPDTIPSTTAVSSTAPPSSAPAPSSRTSATARRMPSAAQRTTNAQPTKHAPPRRAAGDDLPLHLHTGSAKQVITVTASSRRRTTATLQAWRRVGDGWRRVGSATPAHLGSAGMSTHPSESSSATPMGSFTLTQAFGHDADPGTALPYTRTTPDDWWISQPGRLYNTRQRCTAHCDFERGDPNEHLFYETPFYDYAAVIDYNTRNAPGGVRQGAGSAFFLHVTDGRPTAGCVSIAKGRLTRVLRWLSPGEHPRILIGVG